MKTVEISILKAIAPTSRLQLLKLPLVALMFPSPKIVIRANNGFECYVVGETMRDFFGCLVIALNHTLTGETTIVNGRLVTPNEAKHYIVLNND